MIDGGPGPKDNHTDDVCVAFENEITCVGKWDPLLFEELSEARPRLYLRDDFSKTKELCFGFRFWENDFGFRRIFRRSRIKDQGSDGHLKAI